MKPPTKTCETCEGTGQVWDDGDRTNCYPPGWEQCPKCHGEGYVEADYDSHKMDAWNGMTEPEDSCEDS